MLLTYIDIIVDLYLLQRYEITIEFTELFDVEFPIIFIS